MGVDIAVEYVFGFLFGLTIFQALFMRDMLGGSYVGALRASFMPEWLSMNMVMAGMIPAMVVLMMGSDMRAMSPGNLLYWGVMSAAVMVGFVTAFPVNVWLVAKGLKHGMGTVRALGEGGHSLEAERRRDPCGSGGPGGDGDVGDGGEVTWRAGTGRTRAGLRHVRAATGMPGWARTAWKWSRRSRWRSFSR
jgi:hypothetical protein